MVNPKIIALKGIQKSMNKRYNIKKEHPALTMLKQGSKLYAREKYEEAIRLWKQALRKYPNTNYASKLKNYIAKVQALIKA